MTSYFLFLLIPFLITPIFSLPAVPLLLRYAPLAYFRWLLTQPLVLILYIITYLISPFLSAYSVIAGVNVLPGWLALFHTHDNTLDGGQDELGWPKVTGFKLWLQRIKWICRNPAYGFDAYVWGIKSHSTTYVKRWCSDAVWHSGSTNYDLIIFKADNGKNYFSFRYQFYITQLRFIRLWTGWNFYYVVDGTVKIKNAFRPFTTL